MVVDDQHADVGPVGVHDAERVGVVEVAVHVRDLEQPLVLRVEEALERVGERVGPSSSCSGTERSGIAIDVMNPRGRVKAYGRSDKGSAGACAQESYLGGLGYLE
jgi:hypothetical protein